MIDNDSHTPVEPGHVKSLLRVRFLFLAPRIYGLQYAAKPFQLRCGKLGPGYNGNRGRAQLHLERNRT